VGLYADVDETNAFQMAHGIYLCGDSYDKTTNDGRCPNAGSVVFKNSMPAAGTYKIAVVRYIPPNEFGQSGYATTLTHDDTVGIMTVLESGACDAQSVEAAAHANAPATLLADKLARLKAQEAAEQAAEDARLDQAEGVEEELTEAPSSAPVVAQGAEVIISDVDPENPVLWGSAPSATICFTVPINDNVNPKALVLYAGDGVSGQFFPTGIQKAGFENPLPDQAQGCLETSLSPGLPDGQYTVKLQKQWTPVFASTSFYLANANIDFSKLEHSATVLSLWIKWSVSASKASPSDVVKLYNSEGNVIYWFYTSCLCQSSPAQAAKPAGEVRLNLGRAGTKPGGYDLGFFPGGGEFEAANAPDWIDWVGIGW